MSNIHLVKKLVKAHFDRDDHSFKSVASQIAEYEAKMGSRRDYAELKDIIEQRKNVTSVSPSAQITDFEKGTSRYSTNVFTPVDPKARLKHMFLTDSIRHMLMRITAEQLRAEDLSDYGLNPQRKIILQGPSGTGKTMAAESIASDLNLLLVHVNFSSEYILSKSQLFVSNVLSCLRNCHAVYLFKVTNSVEAVIMSKILDKDNSNSLIFIELDTYKTDFSNEWDRDVDSTIDFSLPVKIHRSAFIATNMRPSTNPDESDIYHAISDVAKGLNYKDLIKAIDNTKKHMIMTNSRFCSPSFLEEEILRLKKLNNKTLDT